MKLPKLLSKDKIEYSDYLNSVSMSLELRIDKHILNTNDYSILKEMIDIIEYNEGEVNQDDKFIYVNPPEWCDNAVWGWWNSVDNQISPVLIGRDNTISL